MCVFQRLCNMKRISLLLALAILTVRFKDSHGIVFHSGTILEAQAECGTDGIPPGESLSEYYQLIQLMLKENIGKVWLGIRRKLFGPSWVSTRTTDKEDTVPNMCYALYSRDEILEELPCDKTYGFICEGMVCEDCFKNHRNCLHHGGRCYQIFTKRVVWYKARQLCKQKGEFGADLAVTKNQNLLKELAQKAKYFNRHMRLFWVGKRTLDYEGNKPLEHYVWSEGEPNTENPYVMVVNEDGWVSMKTANSSVKASYYCNQKSSSSNQHITATVIDIQSDKNEDWTSPHMKWLPTTLRTTSRHVYDDKIYNKRTYHFLIILVVTMVGVCIFVVYCLGCKCR